MPLLACEVCKCATTAQYCLTVLSFYGISSLLPCCVVITDCDLPHVCVPLLPAVLRPTWVLYRQNKVLVRVSRFTLSPHGWELH